MPTFSPALSARWRQTPKLLRLLLGVLALAAVGYFYQAFSAARDLARYPALGQGVDVGGYHLHLYCVGEGQPTVILLHGLGGNIYHWAQVQPAIAATTRVCAYDRAGYGWSEAGPQPRSLLQNAQELAALLNNAGIADPVVLVGHSYGTHLAQLYATQHPQRVVGLVLVDGGMATAVTQTCPSLNCMPPTAKMGADIFLGLQPLLFRFGLLRLLGFPQPYGDNLQYLTAEQRAAFTAGYGQTQGAETNLAEWRAWDPQIAGFGTPASLGHLPVRVVMADDPLPDWAYGAEAAHWRGYEEALRVELTHLSTDSQVTVLPNADHASLLFAPAQVQILVDTVEELLARQR